MELRNRTLDTLATQGYVYSIDADTGEEIVLGYSSGTVIAKTSQDYWKKEKRDDGSLPPSSCALRVVYKDPLCMHKNTGTFRFRGHAVSDWGQITTSVYSSIFPAQGSSARNSENAVYVQTLLAATNPFRSEFSVPVAIKELVDIGTLFKIAAKTFSGFLGGNYLNYQFGWKQFVRDIKTLSSITKTLESRIREFDSLTKKGGLRRKVWLDSKSLDRLTLNNTVQSAWGTTVRVRRHTISAVQIHGTVRWRYKLYAPYLELTKLEAFNRAVAVVFDIEDIDPSTAWQLIPFSWLVDYFINLSDFFTASEMDNLIEPYDICIVRKLLVISNQAPTSYPVGMTFSGTGKIRHQEYQRDVVTKGSYPAVRVGLFTKHQLSIMAALLLSFKK